MQHWVFSLLKSSLFSSTTDQPPQSSHWHQELLHQRWDLSKSVSYQRIISKQEHNPPIHKKGTRGSWLWWERAKRSNRVSRWGWPYISPLEALIQLYLLRYHACVIFCPDKTISTYIIIYIRVYVCYIHRLGITTLIRFEDLGSSQQNPRGLTVVS